jgi:hypothetical protein
MSAPQIPGVTLDDDGCVVPSSSAVERTLAAHPEKSAEERYRLAVALTLIDTFEPVETMAAP